MDHDRLREAIRTTDPADLANLLDQIMGTWNLEPWPGLTLWERGIAVIRTLDAASSQLILLPVHIPSALDVASTYRDMIEVRDAAVSELSRIPNATAPAMDTLGQLADALERALGNAYSFGFTASQSFTTDANHPALGLIVSTHGIESGLASILLPRGGGWVVSGGRLPILMKGGI